MKLFLNNQNRSRDISAYKDKLRISDTELLVLNNPKKSILLVGGGLSPHQPNFEKFLAQITNIDLYPVDCKKTLVRQITGDFTIHKGFTDEFDEIWSLYSLPLYAKDKSAIISFFANSIISLKAGGKLRFFPLEFENQIKMKTRDAEWDISSTECTEETIKFISCLEKLNVSSNYITISSSQIDRQEQTVILTIPNNTEEKFALNKKLSDFLADNNSKPDNIEIFI